MTAESTQRSRVLLVEDNPAVRAALLGALESPGFVAMGADDAAEALGVLAQRRVILYSGRMTDELAVEARDFGVRVVLGKPVSAERLVEAVRGRDGGQLAPAAARSRARPDPAPSTATSPR